MRGGALTRRITIQQRTPGKDSAGQAVDVWTDVVSTYAEPQLKAGSEAAAGGAIVSKVEAWFDIRYRTNVTAAMRVVYAGTIYSIEAVMDVDLEHKTIRLLCSAGMKRS